MKKGSTAKEKLARSIGGIICHMERVLSNPISEIVPIRLTRRNASAMWIPENNSINKATRATTPVNSGLIVSLL